MFVWIDPSHPVDRLPNSRGKPDKLGPAKNAFAAPVISDEPGSPLAPPMADVITDDVNLHE
jgi:hypothetical protein